MPTPRPAPAAALLLASAAALPAQTAAPRDSAAREVRRDTVVREYIVRRAGPGDVFDAPGFAFGGPGDVQIFRTRAEPPRSAVGVYLGQADAGGLRVERVAADGPAARAGIAAGDRLVSVGSTSLRVDAADAGDPLLAAVPARRLERAVGRLAPGSEVELRVARDGRERTVRLRTEAPPAVAERGPVVREFRVGPGGLSGPESGPALRGRVEQFRREFGGPAEAGPRARAFVDSARARAAARPVLGLTLDGAGSARDTLGVFVGAVAAGGPAERAGVVEGDRIATINAVDLRVPRDEQGDPQAAGARRARFTRELERLRPGDRATLRVYGDGRWRTVTATVARSADVYRNDLRFGFGEGDAFVLPRLGGVGGRALPRMAPMPGLGAPGVRGFVVPGARRVPLAPMAPLAPRANRRIVRI